MEIVLSIMNQLGFDPAVFASVVAIFYVMHLALKAIIYKPIQKARAKRDLLTSGKVEEAERMNKEALELKSRYDAEIKSCRKAAQERVNEARREAEAERMKRLELARAEAEVIINQSHDDVAKDTATAKSELEITVPALAQSIAVKIARGLLSEDKRAAVEARIKEAAG